MRQGMKVAIGDVDVDAARQAAAELGPSAVALPLDVTERASFAAFLDEAERQLGPIDVLVNNAGIMQIGRFIDEDDTTARRMVDINLHGVILGTKLALERMLPRGRGHIVNISSQAGKYGTPGGATYAATKHAVVGLTEAVRGELRLMGAAIDLSYVMPYVVNTELGSGLGEARGLRSLEPREVAEAIVAALKEGTVEVWVPRSARRTNLLANVMPRRLAEGMARAMRADRVLANADTVRRRDYELRASRSEPALAGAEPPALAAAAAPGSPPAEGAEDVPGPGTPDGGIG
jgi:short-subunit dehydrogenase